jgi:hypothetical protein
MPLGSLLFQTFRERCEGILNLDGVEGEKNSRWYHQCVCWGVKEWESPEIHSICLDIHIHTEIGGSIILGRADSKDAYF